MYPDRTSPDWSKFFNSHYRNNVSNTCTLTGPHRSGTHSHYRNNVSNKCTLTGPHRSGPHSHYRNNVSNKCTLTGPHRSGPHSHYRNNVSNTYTLTGPHRSGPHSHYRNNEAHCRKRPRLFRMRTGKTVTRLCTNAFTVLKILIFEPIHRFRNMRFHLCAKSMRLSIKKLKKNHSLNLPLFLQTFLVTVGKSPNYFWMTSPRPNADDVRSENWR